MDYRVILLGSSVGAIPSGQYIIAVSCVQERCNGVGKQDNACNTRVLLDSGEVALTVLMRREEEPHFGDGNGAMGGKNVAAKAPDEPKAKAVIK